MDQLMQELIKFQTERDWKQFHTPENLAKSISIEAAELLEHFQWNKEYDKDIHSVNKYKKKIISDKEIVNMFNNFIKNNYNFLGTMEIFEDVAVYYRNAVVGTSNISRIFCNLEKVKPIFDEEIHYIYAKDVPTLLFPNSVPNFFPLEGIMFDYIKQFISDIFF